MTNYSQNTLELEITGHASDVAKFIQKIPKDYTVAIYSQEGTLQSDTMNIMLKLSVSPVISGSAATQQNQGTGSEYGTLKPSGKWPLGSLSKEKIRE